MTKNIKLIAIKKSIAIIGSGVFIQDTILPALIVLRDYYHINGFINKSGVINSYIKNLLPDAPLVLNISSLDTDTNLIFICVPASAVKSVLQQLIISGFVNKTILITTPVIALKDLSTLKLLHQIKHPLGKPFC